MTPALPPDGAALPHADTTLPAASTRWHRGLAIALLLCACVSPSLCKESGMTDIPPQALAEKTLHLIESAAGHTTFTADWVGKALALPMRVVGGDPGNFVAEGQLGQDWTYRLYAQREAGQATTKRLSIEINPGNAAGPPTCPLVMSAIVQRLQQAGFKAQRHQNRLGSPRWWMFLSDKVAVNAYGGPNDDSSDDLACVNAIYIYLPD